MSHSTNEQAVDHGFADPEALRRLRRWGGEDLVRDLVHMFEVEAPRRMALAYDAATRGDWTGVGSAAHSLKSSCAQIGAIRMRDICADIEFLAANGTSSSIPSLLESLDGEFTAFTAWLTHTTDAFSEGPHE